MEQNSNHDMNLFDLIVLCCKAIGRFFCRCFHTLGSMLRLSFRRWYIVLPVVLLALGVALYYARPSNRMYKVGVMVHLNGVHANDVKQQWDKLVKAAPTFVSDEQSFARMLQIPDTDAVSLSHFAYYNVVDCKHDSVPDFVDFSGKHNLADTVDVVMDDYLYLQFRTRLPQKAVEIGKATIDYLNRDALMQQKFQHYRNALEQKVHFCQQQVQMLDSLTYDFYFRQGGNSQQYNYNPRASILAGRRELRMLHPQAFELLDASIKTEYLNSIAQAPVLPLSDFTIDPRAVNGPIRSSLLGILIGYLLGCLIALCVDKRKVILSWLLAKK